MSSSELMAVFKRPKVPEATNRLKIAILKNVAHNNRKTELNCENQILLSISFYRENCLPFIGSEKE